MSKSKRTKAKIKKKQRRKAKKLYEAENKPRNKKDAPKARSTSTDEILRECGAWDL